MSRSYKPTRLFKMIVSPQCMRTVVGLILCVHNCVMLEIYLDDSSVPGDTCKHNQGKLLSYDDLLNSRIKGRVMELLKVEQSARLSGVARFSPYITFKTCFFIRTHAAFNEHFVHKLSNVMILINCVINCSQRKLQYVGVSSEGCYCFNQTTMDYASEGKYEASSTSDCGKIRATLFRNKSTKLIDNNIIVYSLQANSNNHVVLNDTLPYFNQCKYVKKSDNNSSKPLTYLRKSCSSNDLRGFICFVCLSRNECNGTDDRKVTLSNNKGTYCIVNKQLPLDEAETYCKKNPGNLISLVHDEIAEVLEENSLYRLDVFREFQIDENAQTNDGQCVTVVKSADLLLVEANENCTNIPSLCSSAGKPEANTLAIIFGVSVGCVLVTVVVTLTVKLVYKQKEHRYCCRQTQEAKSDIQNDTHCARTNDDPSFQENSTAEYKSADSYSNADISEEHASGIDTNYEVIQRTTENSLSMMEQSASIHYTTDDDTSDYDKLGQHMKAGATSARGSTIYNHVPCGKTEDEYDTCIKRSDQLADQSGIYNTVVV